MSDQKPLADANIPEDELPGMLAVGLGIRDQQWPHTVDARVWAKKWMERHQVDREANANDEGTMLGWFANAIMAGYDTAQMRAAARVHVPREPTEVMQNAGINAMFTKGGHDLKRRELFVIVRKGWRAMYDASPINALPEGEQG